MEFGGNRRQTYDMHGVHWYAWKTRRSREDQRWLPAAVRTTHGPRRGLRHEDCQHDTAEADRDRRGHRVDERPARRRHAAGPGAVLVRDGSSLRLPARAGNRIVCARPAAAGCRIHRGSASARRPSRPWRSPILPAVTFGSVSRMRSICPEVGSRPPMRRWLARHAASFEDLGGTIATIDDARRIVGLSSPAANRV